MGYKTNNAFTIIAQLDGKTTSMTLASGGVRRAGEREKTYFSFYGMASVCVCGGGGVLSSHFVLFG